MRDVDARYFERIDEHLEDALSVAQAARAQGKDPSEEVEIPVAEDMADRVENLLEIPGVADRVRSLEAEGYGREAAVLELAQDFAEGRVGDYDTREGKIEGAVRTAVALLTEGVVAAPIEGIDRVELAFNDDGSEFVRVFYAGPVRSAGGTAQALSVLVADYVRALLGIDRYKPREDEIERYAEEVDLYDDDVGLQYTPSAAEIKYIARHCPVMLDGESTGGEEVSGYRDLERVGTNTARGGMCLVLAEGIALKAPKIKRYTRQLEEIDWPWLDDLIDGTIPGQDPKPATDGGTQADDGATEAPSPEYPAAASNDAEDRLKPDGKYLRDLIAGRPVFAHPSEPGGFRLRYGRARNHGFATAGVHPATMHIVDDFLATGTQLKTERPGKAAGVVPVDTIDGPTVKLASGEVRRIDDPETALELRNGVVEILDIGEYLVNYGEFVENNHPLAPASYVVEWWQQEFAAAGADLQALEDAPEIDLAEPSASTALEWAETYDAPLHPAYTYLWHDLDVEAFEALADAVADGTVTEDGLRVANTDAVTEALETLLVPHQQGDTVTIEDWRPLVRSVGFDDRLSREWEQLSRTAREAADALTAVNEVAPFTVRERAPTRVGSRMGRPEKSEVREMNPAVHGLFPIGEAGGDQRDVGAAAQYTDDMQDTPGQVEVEVGRRRCPNCGTEGVRPACPECGTHTQPEYHCRDCGTAVEPDGSGRLICPRCDGEGTSVDSRTIDVRGAYQDALDAMGERENAFEILKGVKGLMSATKTPEPLEKGVLRAVHGVSTFKDGTVRYDMTDLPVTSVRPAELDVSVEQFRALGYERDVNGEPLEYDDQLVALRAQDIVLSSGAAQHLMQVADFVDDLLERFYGLDPFYEVEERGDLVGALVFGLAPHTSAAVVGRIVGFTDAAVGYAHPYFHAAKRRNCFHPDTSLWCADEAGEWQYVAIADLVEERLQDPEQYATGTLVESLDGSVTVPALSADGSATRSPVTAVSKHPAPDHLIEISTADGRSVTVTPDHTMLRWTDELDRVRASELGENDRLPAWDGGETTMSGSGDNPVADDGPAVPLTSVTDIEYIESDVDYTYCLTVEDTHSVVANGLYVAQCDGDEDCVMLLMDGLLNFSQSYLPDRRGGRMDAPLVMSSRIDPTEIDDEAHNMDTVDAYPVEFYEATRRLADPSDVEIQLAGDLVETEDAYAGFAHTHDTSNIALGPALSAYKTLESMTDKLDAQLELARKLAGVDETDVAERIIEYHFLPDLLGNLRAFSRQETRCLDCGTKYRRMPLTGSCRECGGNVNLTVHEGSVSKYLETAIDIAETYGAREYTKQRLQLLERTIESVFENDKDRPSTLGEFM
ncbi:MAG: DNA-directed DNA polymerase II large subunit [Halobacteriales archaeon]